MKYGISGYRKQYQQRGVLPARLTAFAAASLLAFSVGQPAQANDRAAPAPTFQLAQAAPERTGTMKIRMTINGQVAMATLENTPAAKAFAALLPLNLTLTDYASTEKISDLPQRLPQEGSPPGFTPVIGDITYYAPWGNLAIFYRDFGYSRGLLKLGHIDSGVEALNQSGPLQTTLELITP